MALKTYLDDLWDHEIRSDGRTASELRKINCELGIFNLQASGSASFSIGNTKVIAAVYGPHEVRSSMKKHQSNPDKMVINVEYSSACFSSNERRKSAKNDRKSMEVSANLKSIIQNIIVQDTFSGSQIDVYVELIQDDGGSYSACINASTLALVDAGIPIRDYAVSCTSTLSSSLAMADINSFERGTGAPELTVAILPSTSQLIALEQSHLFQLIYLDDVIRVGVEGCKEVHRVMEKAVGDKFQRTKELSLFI